MPEFNLPTETKLNGSIKFDLPINKVICVCGYCNHHDNQNATIELNFGEKKIIYLCSACKKENQISFMSQLIPPYPKIGVSA